MELTIIISFPLSNLCAPSVARVKLLVLLFIGQKRYLISGAMQNERSYIVRLGWEFRFNLEDFKYRGFEKVKSAEWVNLLTEILLDDCSKTKSLTYNFLPICIRWYIEYFLLDTRKLLYEELPAISKAFHSILLEFRVSCLYWALSAPPKRFCNYFGLFSEESPPTVAINGHMFLCHQLIVWA